MMSELEGSGAAASSADHAPTQYLRVDCNVTRVVMIDEKSVGRTDELLELPAGVYTVSLLSPPDNFRPKYRRVKLDDTSSEKPLILRFETR